MVPPKRPLAERFWEKVDRRGPNECWPWLGGIQTGGYGHFYRNGGSALAHRVAYELVVGPIPEGFEIDHVRARGCSLRSCVNPAHLEAVTSAENMRRARRTHCPRGHEYTPENIRLHSNGYKMCRRCRSEQDRARGA